LGIVDCVCWFGYVVDDDLLVLFVGVCCFVFLSLYEGFGLLVVEVMVLGCLVICLDMMLLLEMVVGVVLLVDLFLFIVIVD